jgi:tetratricopeptide (TPR) repeat protein
VAAEEAGTWAAALPHLDALLVAQPAGAGLHSRRGKAHAALGHWEPAVLDFAQATEQAPDDCRNWLNQAMAQLAAGDTSGYQRNCAAMLARFERPNETFLVALAGVTAPEGVTDAARLVALTERRAKASPESARLLTMWGAALYRAEWLEEAVQRLMDANALGSDEEALRWLFLAMAHARLGHGAEARLWLAKATAWIDERLARRPESLLWQYRLILPHLRREAEALMPPAGAR